MQEQLDGLLPVTQITHSTLNLMTIVLTLATIALLASLLAPADAKLEDIDESKAVTDPEQHNQKRPLTARLVWTQFRSAYPLDFGWSWIQFLIKAIPKPTTLSY